MDYVFAIRFLTGIWRVFLSKWLKETKVEGIKLYLNTLGLEMGVINLNRKKSRFSGYNFEPSQY